MRPDLRRALKAHARKCGHCIEVRRTCRQSTDDTSLWCIGCVARAMLEEADNPPVHLMRDDEWRSRTQSAFRFLEEQGYRYCDTPACNCGSWHKP